MNRAEIAARNAQSRAARGKSADAEPSVSRMRPDAHKVRPDFSARPFALNRRVHEKKMALYAKQVQLPE